MGNPFPIRLALFVTLGAPFLLGYGVNPQPNFINEVTAVLGFGFVLLIAQGALPAGRGGRWAVATAVFLLLCAVRVAVQWMAAAEAPDPSLYVTQIAYFLVALAALALGLQVGQAEVAERFLVGVGQVLLVAGLLTWLAQVVQYFNLPFHWAMVPMPENPGRAFAFIRQPNHQASLLALSLAATVYLYLAGALHRWACKAVALVFIAGLLMTGSRTGLVQLLVIGLSAWFWLPLSRRQRWMLLLAIGVAFTLMALGLWWLKVHWGIDFYAVAKLQQTVEQKGDMRWAIWTHTLGLIADAPWLGHGVQKFSSIFFLSGAAASVGVVMGNAHNLFLQLAFEYGVWAALGAAVLLGGVLVTFRRQPVSQERRFALLGMACLFTHSLLEFPLWYFYFLIPFFLFMGVLLATDGRGAGSPRWLQSLGVLAGAGLIGAAVWANFDFYKLSPVFRKDPDVSLAERLAHADGVFWFSRYQRFVKLAATGIRATGPETYVREMKALTCVMPDPLYLIDFPVALAWQGDDIAAERVVYLYSRMNASMVQVFKARALEMKEPRLARAVAFADQVQPVAVEPSAVVGCLASSLR